MAGPYSHRVQHLHGGCRGAGRSADDIHCRALRVCRTRPWLNLAVRVDHGRILARWSAHDHARLAIRPRRGRHENGTAWVTGLRLLLRTSGRHLLLLRLTGVLLLLLLLL